MTIEDRLQAAIRCESGVRICVAPKIEEYAGRVAGISNADFIFDEKKALDSLDLCYDILGGWDLYRAVYSKVYGPLQKTIGLTRARLPGMELPEDSPYQAIEEEVMQAGDYEYLFEHGSWEFGKEFWRRAHGVTDVQIGKALRLQRTLENECNERARGKGMLPLYGGFIPFALDFLSFCRSLRSFAIDLYRRPKTVERALEMVTEYAIGLAIKAVEETGIPRIFMGFTRGSGVFMSPKMFDRFVFPHLRRMVDALHARGIVLFLHADSDWSLHLDAFRALPAHSVVLELDGTTDMLKAKSILRGHTCLLGDVNATKLTLGRPEEIRTYCSTLIRIVGEGGGFILGSGCTIPMTAQQDNVAALVGAVAEKDWTDEKEGGPKGWSLRSKKR